MKTSNFKKVISVMLMCFMLVGTLVGFSVSAETADPTIEIVSNNVEYGDDLKLMYAVEATNVPEGASIKVVIYDENGEFVANTVAGDDVTLDGVTLPTFVSEYGVAAQNISTVLYAEAQIVDAEGNVLLKSAQQEYSVLEYLWERKTICDSTDYQIAMYDALLTYAETLDIAINKGTATDDNPANFSYVAVVDENNEILYADMYVIGDVIKKLDTDLVATDTEQIVWTIDAATKITMTNDDLAATGYIVTADAAVFTAELISNAVIASTYTLAIVDNGFTISTSYVAQESTDGWVGANISAQSQMNTTVLILNGKTTAVGKLTSPTLNTGIQEISFQYTNVFSESKGVDLQINIYQDGAVVATYQLDDDSVTKNTAETFTWTLDEAISGEIVIEIVNNSPSNSTSNKDRVAIWDITWTGYVG